MTGPGRRGRAAAPALPAAPGLLSGGPRTVRDLGPAESVRMTRLHGMPATPTTLLAAAAAAALLPAPASMAGASSPILRPSAGTAVHPPVSGAAGPHRRVVVTLSRDPGGPGGSFSAAVRVAGGRRLRLPPPDEPIDLFYLQPRAVLFAPVRGAGPGNCVVVLYDSSRIGPGHGTEHRALVYRVTASGAVRLPAAERRLDGAADAATARARLAEPADRRRPPRRARMRPGYATSPSGQPVR